MFADVVGSTALGERTEPEVLQRMMTAHAVLAREIIESNGGLVEKFIGDAVMAVFGLPTAREDDAVRAVRAAVELRARTRLPMVALWPAERVLADRPGRAGQGRGERRLVDRVRTRSTSPACRVGERARPMSPRTAFRHR